MKMLVAYQSIASAWSEIVFKRAFLVLAAAATVTVLALQFASGLSVSTRLEDLMPEGAKSVQSLTTVLEKSGSFASIQIVARSDDPVTTREFLSEAKNRIEQHDWVAYSQYSEDVEALTRHKLLMLEVEELRELEQEIEDAYPVFLAQKLSEVVGADVSLSIRNKGVAGTSTDEVDQDRIDALTHSLENPPPAERFFTTKDDLTGVLVVWPKPGLESLSDAKRMVDDARAVTEALASNRSDGLRAGVAGRIANKVAQFDAVTGDLKLSLISAISLIALLIAAFYRRVAAILFIVIPLVIGLIWTFGLTSLAIGGLNLITVFLVLILFGLGIDFGIHNFSRYNEVRRRESAREAIRTVIVHTGGASLVAALTTSIGFFSLILTDFRAFSEFGFIAGAGIALIFTSMYSVFPALVVVAERITPRMIALRTKSGKTASISPVRVLQARVVAPVVVCILAFAIFFAPKITFERNFKNLEASQPESLVWATGQVNQVFGSGHDRAVLAVQTLTELLGVSTYFDQKIAEDQATPTIEKTSSIFDFAPPDVAQEKRLEIIQRLNKRVEELKSVDKALYASAKQYLDIDALTIADLPEALRRAYLGESDENGYLFYIYNSVSMDDSALARQFYDDAASFVVNGKEYVSASEGFIFVEMIALMKTDALKAILLVAFSTTLLVLLFTRSFFATAVILAPPVLGVVVTIAVMGAVGLPLSIMNMVILPSLIGIAVDNAIHIFHRYESGGPDVDISSVMTSTGRAAALTTVTTLIGFGGLVTASMGGLKSMGALAIIGFSTSLFLTWVLLPGLLSLHQERQAQRVRGRLVSY